jgi:hypothetical protein
MRQQGAIQQKAGALELGSIEEAIGGQKAPARIGESASQRRVAGHEAPAGGAKEGFEFSRKFAQSRDSPS